MKVINSDHDSSLTAQRLIFNSAGIVLWALWTFIYSILIVSFVRVAVAVLQDALNCCWGSLLSGVTLLIHIETSNTRYPYRSFSKMQDVFLNV